MNPKNDSNQRRGDSVSDCWPVESNSSFATVSLRAYTSSKLLHSRELPLQQPKRLRLYLFNYVVSVWSAPSSCLLTLFEVGKIGDAS